MAHVRPAAYYLTMSKTGKFETAWLGVARGVRITVTSKDLCADCLSPEAVDHEVKMLKADLDGLAKRMKALLRAHEDDPPFPEANDVPGS